MGERDGRSGVLSKQRIKQKQNEQRQGGETQKEDRR
jgi:hypothetical protein